MSDLKNETTRETVDFEHFGRTWTVPSKARFTHMEAIANGASDVAIVHTFLDADQIKALRQIDPDIEALDEFGNKIVEAVGLKNTGN